MQNKVINRIVVIIVLYQINFTKLFYHEKYFMYTQFQKLKITATTEVIS